MNGRTTRINFLVTVASVCVIVSALGATVQAADGDDAPLTIRARAISTLNISRAAADRVEIRISHWSSDADRRDLVNTLVTEGNTALADRIADQPEIGWFRFDPRGGGGPGRDPRKTDLRYARDIIEGNSRDIILVTNHYIGFGNDARAADGSRLVEYPLSVVLLSLEKNDTGEWAGLGRLFVGTKIRYDRSQSRFVIDEFPSDPVYLKDVVVK